MLSHLTHTIKLLRSLRPAELSDAQLAVAVELCSIVAYEDYAVASMYGIARKTIAALEHVHAQVTAEAALRGVECTSTIDENPFASPESLYAFVLDDWHSGGEAIEYQHEPYVTAAEAFMAQGGGASSSHKKTSLMMHYVIIASITLSSIDEALLLRQMDRRMRRAYEALVDVDVPALTDEALLKLHDHYDLVRYALDEYADTVIFIDEALRIHHTKLAIDSELNRRGLTPETTATANDADSLTARLNEATYEAFDPETILAYPLEVKAKRAMLMCDIRRHYRDTASDAALQQALEPFNSSALMQMVHQYEPTKTVDEAMMAELALILANANDNISDPRLKAQINQALASLSYEGIVAYEHVLPESTPRPTDAELLRWYRQMSDDGSWPDITTAQALERVHALLTHIEPVTGANVRLAASLALRHYSNVKPLTPPPSRSCTAANP